MHQIRRSTSTVSISDKRSGTITERMGNECAGSRCLARWEAWRPAGVAKHSRAHSCATTEYSSAFSHEKGIKVFFALTSSTRGTHRAAVRVPTKAENLSSAVITGLTLTRGKSTLAADGQPQPPSRAPRGAPKPRLRPSLRRPPQAKERCEPGADLERGLHAPLHA